MNTIKGARVKWAEVFEDPNLTLDSLKARALSQHSSLGIDGIRSVCWKVYLSCLPTLEVSTWPFALAKERERYAELRRKYIKAIGSDDGPEPDLEVNNPLSLAEDSPWQQFFVDSELRKIIQQDVERTFPDNDYFRSEKVQEQMGDILFIYCKINHDVSYRQGMHELVAHMLWVVSSESLDTSSELESSTDSSLDVMKSVLNPIYVEHDTFALFSSLMSRAKPWYEFSDEGFSSKRARPTNNSNNIQPFGKPEQPAPAAGKQTPVIEWSMKIFQHLQRIDNELYLHLQSLEIQPQLFGIRWFRLLFGREFPMDEVFILWDGIFAKDPSLKICIFIGVAMLLQIRDELLEGDFAECLHRLMRYPSIKDIHLFIPQALRLQELPNGVGGQEVIRQNDILAGKAVAPQAHVQSESDYDSSQQHRTESTSQHHHHQQQQQQQHQHHSQQTADQSRGQGLSFPGNGVFSQHLPPAALDAIKPVAEGFAHVTKNVLESKGGAVLNKAIHDMKKNTQSYIRKTNASANAPTSPATANFPPMFDQAISSTGRLAASSRPASSPPKSHHGDKQVHSQLGHIVAKALEIFEAEFFSPSTTSAQEPNNDAVNVPSKSALVALSGLQHVRDVLFGVTREVDPHIIESGMLAATYAAKEAVGGNGESSPRSSPVVHASQDIPAAATGASPSTARRLPINASTPTTGAKTATNLPRGGSPARESGPPDRRGSPQYLAEATGSAIAVEARSRSAPAPTPAFEPEVVPSPPPLPPTPPKPFSFDDLINDPLVDSSSSSSVTVHSSTPKGSRLSGLGGANNSGSSNNLLGGSGGSPMSKVKSPRSSLAHSQFSWMLNDSPEGAGSTGSGGAGSISRSGSGLRPAAEISSLARPGIDPLAGFGGSSGSSYSISGSSSSSSSKRNTSGLGSSILLQQDGSQPKGEDPLRT